MGYKCDVCSTEDAAVFCFADQAVMCAGCDSRVHSANKVVRKHERVSLQKESDAATCDICQEHNATMFCSEDRALICRRCDLMIHNANEFVAKHHRYLLSGVAVGLKALDSEGKDASASGEEGKSKRPYSLRNSNGQDANKDFWKASNDREAWRNGTAEPSDGQPASPKGGLSRSATLGSQPNLINPSIGNSPSLGALTGASLITPFGTKDEQEQRMGGASPSTSPPSSQQDAGLGNAGFGGWGMESVLHPGSSDFTLAAELLGMPSMAQGYTAKDIDAAYIFDDNDELDANLSALLEVPDLEFLHSENPVVLSSHHILGSGGRKGSLGNDVGVVPDFQQQSDVGSLKRQRIQ